MGKMMPKISIDQKIDIPISRGLGSSAACIAAGCAAGNILAEANLSDYDLIKLGASIEGHPDNVVPAFLGGYTISSIEKNEIIYFRQEAFKGFKYAVMIPKFTLSTAAARKVLPETVPYKDAVFNIGKSALMSAAMITGDGELLKSACKDKLHQPYRKHLIPGFDEIKGQADSVGALATFLSGAGSSIVSVLNVEDNIFEKEMNRFLRNIDNNWTLRIVKASNSGVQINKLSI